MDKNFNGFESEEQYLSIYNTLKDIQEKNDTYDRDTLMVYKEVYYIEFYLDDYCIRIWGENNVEVYILDEDEHLVDNGIMNVCWVINECLRNGELNF